MKYLEKSTFNHYVSYKIFTIWRDSDYTQHILHISSCMHGMREFDHMKLSWIVVFAKVAFWAI